mmetsp:Transcript_106182/g.307274  ORF Transcript_106182/g.307274 Transcript_106182/m.307274 type:complete len:219 (+) Transcript_106182:1264-1920(+)
MKSSHVLELRVDERAALRAEQHVARLHLPRHLAGHDLHDVVSERINGSFGVLESDAGEVGLGVIHWSEVHRAATRLQQQEVVEGREGRGAGAVDNRGDGHLLLFGDIPQLVGELGGRDRVEAGGRLVQEEDPRVRHELECHVHALTLGDRWGGMRWGRSGSQHSCVVDTRQTQEAVGSGVLPKKISKRLADLAARYPAHDLVADDAVHHVVQLELLQH